MTVSRTAQPTTPFARLCAERGLLSPSAFLPAFAETAHELGEDVCVTARQFQRWRMHSPPCPRQPHLRVLHALFGISPDQMGFPIPEHGAQHQAPAHWDSRSLNNVERRQFFAIGAAAGAAAAGVLPGSGPLPSLPAGGPVGSGHVPELRRALADLYALDDTYGGGDVRPLAVRLLRRIRRVINTGTYPDTIGRQLQLAAGQTAEHCGWLCFDAGRQHDARRFWGEALTTATVLHDAALEVAVLASMSMQALFENRAREAYDLARAAQERAADWSSPSLLSLLAAREARALARMHDHQGARRALARSMRLLERAEARHPVPEWADFHGLAELSYAQGLLYAESGHHQAAVPYVRAALAQQHSAYGRNRALYRLTLADAMIRSGDTDEGCAEAISVAQHLDELGSGRARRQLKTIGHLLSSVDAASVRQATEQLAQITQQNGPYA
jgi:tetratricopeptide (TPR) repeat protein